MTEHSNARKPQLRKPAARSSSKKTAQARHQGERTGRKTSGSRFSSSANKTPHRSRATSYSSDRDQGGRHQKRSAPTNRSNRNVSGSKTNRAPGRRSSTTTKKVSTSVNIPPAGDNIRVIPLGGVEEVGKNMYAFERGNDIIVVDAGFQFVSEEEASGVDYILPNTKYLEERKDKIRALVVTHGHLDHIGGIPYIMDRIGNPPIYTREITSIMIKGRQAEFPHLPELNIKVVEPSDRITFNDLSISFFSVTHSIPDSMGVVIETPYGNVIITGDLKLDHEDGIPTKEEEKVWGEVGKKNNLMFIADSTNAEQTGFSMPERNIHKTLEKLIKEADGRIIIGTFASQFHRMIKIVEICERYNKKVITEGRSMRNNIEIAQKVGILKPKEGTLISSTEIDNYPVDRIVVIATGAQGEEFAALMRIATKKHKQIALTKRDTVILSSSVIPGNELSVQKLKDNLYRHGAKLVHYRTAEVHSTGHGNQEDLKWINKKVGAKFFIPAFGYHSMLRVHAQVIHEENGIPEENIVVPDNGTIVEITDKGKKLEVRKEKAPSNIVMVDGLSIGDVQEVVIRDRQMLAQDGIFVIIAILDVKSGKVRKSPDIISRGFVYLKESQDLLHQARFIVKRTIEDKAAGMNPVDFDYIKKEITNSVGKFLLQQTAKRPMVLPVILGV